MSYLKFERIGHMQLYSREDAILGSWPAHNDTASYSNGRWPSGRYAWSHYNRHPQMGLAPACISTPFGCEGIHVFDVSVHGRTGMGIHAGRAWKVDVLGPRLGGRSLGCVRTTEDAMAAINRTHAVDPLAHVVIDEGWFAYPIGRCLTA